MNKFASISTRARPGECSDADFRAIADLVAREAGIFLAPEKKPLVVSRLSHRLRVLGLNDFGAYHRLVEDRINGAAERRSMIAELTTNVTRFLRERHHFAHLQNDVLPALIQRARAGDSVRLWSAGCSSGEEAFTLAMSVLEACPETHALDLKILATDIDPLILATARAARYDAAAIQPLPAQWQEQHFLHHRDGTVTVADNPRDLVTFRELNLIADWPLSVDYDVIFCRNVAIYFTRETQQTLWARFYRQMRPGGILYIGHSERLSPEISSHFTPLEVTAFQRDALPSLRERTTK